MGQLVLLQHLAPSHHHHDPWLARPHMQWSAARCCQLLLTAMHTDRLAAPVSQGVQGRPCGRPPATLHHLKQALHSWLYVSCFTRQMLTDAGRSLLAPHAQHKSQPCGSGTHLPPTL